MKYRINTTITHDELVGLSFVCDSLDAHLKAGEGTGCACGDAQARAAAAWIGRLAPVPVRARSRRKP